MDKTSLDVKHGVEGFSSFQSVLAHDLAYFPCKLPYWNTFFKLGFTPCKTEQPLQGMELQEEEAQKD